MKLFIWYGDGVLQSWSSGQIACIAKDLSTALQVIDEEMGYESESFPREDPTEVIELGIEETQQRAWIVWGSD
ncbi:hypothetical protein A5886_002174 [Enterococcus sp. 8G7_MSG3316]|uniref:Uncharacterized protein n=1 Tax=Candidatus Enterococcus testudinis TaxID=1834191 RepID=A0A242A7U3_9ENTE|nr:hypothetical protein [Enterococcus sp. 8G7_MSG3316]OTN77094.1 hypothetical protein A5886_002174 [Enterococcus sp. 8G7_MSG3316]